MTQKNLETWLENWCKSLKNLSESIAKLSVDELMEVINWLSEEQKERMLIVLKSEKSLIENLREREKRKYLEYDEIEEEE